MAGYKPISIHAPREGCDAIAACLDSGTDISIHAPREGCDKMKGTAMQEVWQFQSTHPVRGATMVLKVKSYHRNISIHAPREGCDITLQCYIIAMRCISIHAPREGCDATEVRRESWNKYFNPRTP